MAICSTHRDKVNFTKRKSKDASLPMLGPTCSVSTRDGALVIKWVSMSYRGPELRVNSFLEFKNVFHSSPTHKGLIPLQFEKVLALYSHQLETHISPQRKCLLFSGETTPHWASLLSPMDKNIPKASGTFWKRAILSLGPMQPLT